ncbi:MAG: hypothetical protein F4229_14110 [Gammaproteobacteria bacterium]|nr:hypothetical protein [Gammaproteobacteria bacterium]
MHIRQILSILTIAGATLGYAEPGDRTELDSLPTESSALTIQMRDTMFDVDDASKLLVLVSRASSDSDFCKAGDACDDIDYQWNEETSSFHFFNDGSRKIFLKVTSATYFGCSGYKAKRMRPGQEWDTGFSGLCHYEANYR